MKENLYENMIQGSTLEIRRTKVFRDSRGNLLKHPYLSLMLFYEYKNGAEHIIPLDPVFFDTLKKQMAFVEYQNIKNSGQLTESSE